MTGSGPFEVRPLTPAFGAEIIGIDLEQAASPEVFPLIHEAWLRYQVLVFPAIEVPPASQVAFAAKFGEVQVHVMNQYLDNADHPELYVLSNLDENGKPSGKHPDKAHGLGVQAAVDAGLTVMALKRGQHTADRRRGVIADCGE